MADLTEKQRRFVEAYMGKARGNATEAARLAGYKGNRETLASVGKENLRKPQIREAIGERVERDPLVMTREDAQRRLSAIAMGLGVVPVMVDDIPAVHPDNPDEDLMHPARMSDQIKALELLARICRWLDDATDPAKQQPAPVRLTLDVGGGDAE